MTSFSASLIASSPTQRPALVTLKPDAHDASGIASDGGNLSLLDEPVWSALDATLQVVGDRYSLMLIAALSEAPLRFIELEDALESISPKTLSARLKHLEEHTLIRREETLLPTGTAKVTYHLQPKARLLLPVLMELAQWYLLNPQRR
jgi:DNA-binding HxlR family transcriptional regulator